MIYVNFYDWHEPKWYRRVYQYLVNLFSPKYVHVDIQLPLVNQRNVQGYKYNAGSEVLVTSTLKSGVQLYELGSPSRKPAETYMLAVDVENVWPHIDELLGRKYSFFGYPTAVFGVERKSTKGLSCVETVCDILCGCVGRDSAASSVIAGIRRAGVCAFTPSELRDLFAQSKVTKL